MVTICIRTLKLVSAVIFGLGVSACALENLSGDVYTREEARRVQTVDSGVVVSVSPIIIEGDTEGTLGSGGGAVIGGIAGSSVGGGRGSQVASVLGAIAGSVAGQKAEERLTRKQGQEIMVQRDSGETIVVVQEVVDGKFFQPGEKVRLIQHGGVMRVRY